MKRLVKLMWEGSMLSLGALVVTCIIHLIIRKERKYQKELHRLLFLFKDRTRATKTLETRLKDLIYLLKVGTQQTKVPGQDQETPLTLSTKLLSVCDKLKNLSVPEHKEEVVISTQNLMTPSLIK